MANKFTAGLAISLLLSSSCCGLAYADDATSALEKQIMNGDAAPSTGNPDHFPWMNKDGSAKSPPKPDGTSAAPSTSVAPPPPVRSEPIPPAPTADHKTAVDEHKPAVDEHRTPTAHAEPVREEKLKVEHAEAATVGGSKEEKLPHVKVTPAPSTERASTERAVETSSATARKPSMLYGRIEQLSASAGASFPSLKAQIPKMDPRGMTLTAKATTAAPVPLSGSVVRSFPANYQGTWGGRLVLQQVQVDPNYYRIDPEEARRTVQAMKPGNIGQVNFNFDRSRGAIALEPARCMFMVPASDTQVPDEVNRMMGGGNAALGGMMSQMMSGMTVPIVLEFGDIQTSGEQTSVSGNALRQRVLKNETRQLAPNVMEQQIITEETTWNKRTHVPLTGFGESVIRFTRQSPTVLYVQAATVSYGGDKKFLRKMVLYGSIGKGVVMNTDPMAAMQGGMPNMGGMGGMGAMQGMFGGAGAQRGGAQMPTTPAGGIDGMLKNLFGGQ